MALGVVALGVVAERQRYDWADTREWVLDLLVGWTLAGLGLAAFALGRPRGAAALLAVAGVTWFVGNFYGVEPDWLGWAATHLGWLFLAALVHLALGFPTGRPRATAVAFAVAAAWVAAIVPWVEWGDRRWTPAVLAGFAAVGLTEWRCSSGRRGRDAAYGAVALVGLAAWAIVIPRLGSVGAWSLRAIGFDAGIVAVGVWLFSGLRSPTAFAERVIELDESAGTLREALARLLGDPTLQVGYATSAGVGFFDDAGLPLASPAPGSATTEVRGDSGVVGIVVHHPAVVATSEDRRAVMVAVALAAERASLREDVRRRADEVFASTQRLIRAGDDERVRLGNRIASGTGHCLSEAAQLVSGLNVGGADPELEVAVERLAVQFDRACAELVSYAGGLGIRALNAGLEVAIRELVDGLPLHVETCLDAINGWSPEIEATAWFVCAEGVANVLKHAGASRLEITVTREAGLVRVVVADDGLGGADPAGLGLSGLGERVSALGGTLLIESPGGVGTRVIARLPAGEAVL
jgi:signal transduction histidine kinase